MAKSTASGRRWGSNTFGFIQRWGWSEWSTFATILCAIDCTVLPAVMAIVPVLGWMSPNNLHSLHNFSHWAAMYIMVPLALIAIASNFIKSRRLPLMLWGLTGVGLVFLAHSPHCLEVFFPDSPLLETVHDWHTLVSLFGAANVIASNYVSHHISGHSSCHHCCQHSSGKATSEVETSDDRTAMQHHHNHRDAKSSRRALYDYLSSEGTGASDDGRRAAPKQRSPTRAGSPVTQSQLK